MQTAIFGPVFWTAIHLVSFNYPVEPTEEQKVQYKNWLLAMGDVLPCRHCRDNFGTNVSAALGDADFDSVFESRDVFSRFCYDLHEVVNLMLKKPQCKYSFNEVRDMYEGFRSRCLTKEQEAKLLQSHKEMGCLHEKHTGTKAKCVLQVVPRDINCEGLSVADECRAQEQL